MSFLFTSFDFSIPFPRISFCFITLHSKPQKISVFCSWSEKRTIKQFEFLINSWKKYVGRIVLPPSHLPKCQDLHRCSPFSSQYCKVILVLSLFESFSFHRVWPTQRVCLSLQAPSRSLSQLIFAP